MWRFDISPEAQQLLETFRNTGDLMEVLRKALEEQMWYTVGHIQAKYMSFPKDGPPMPNGLRVQSNRLRGSQRQASGINQRGMGNERPVVNGTRIYTSIGSNVRYAGVHEYGFDGTVTVPPHTRRNFKTMEFQRAKGEFVFRPPARREGESQYDFDLRWEQSLRRQEKAFETAGPKFMRKRVRSADERVGKYSYHLKLPARRYVSQGIEDTLPNIARALSRTIIEHLGGKAT